MFSSLSAHRAAPSPRRPRHPRHRETHLTSRPETVNPTKIPASSRMAAALVGRRITHEYEGAPDAERVIILMRARRRSRHGPSPPRHRRGRHPQGPPLPALPWSSSCPARHRQTHAVLIAPRNPARRRTATRTSSPRCRVVLRRYAALAAMPVIGDATPPPLVVRRRALAAEESLPRHQRGRAIARSNTTTPSPETKQTVRCLFFDEMARSAQTRTTSRSSAKRPILSGLLRLRPRSPAPSPPPALGPTRSGTCLISAPTSSPIPVLLPALRHAEMGRPSATFS